MIIYYLSPRRLGVLCPRKWTYLLGLFCFQVPAVTCGAGAKETKKPLVDCDLHIYWELIFIGFTAY